MSILHTKHIFRCQGPSGDNPKPVEAGGWGTPVQELRLSTTRQTTYREPT